MPGQGLNQAAEPESFSTCQCQGANISFWRCGLGLLAQALGTSSPTTWSQATVSVEGLRGWSPLAFLFQGPNSWTEWLLGSGRPLNSPSSSQALPLRPPPPFLLVLDSRPEEERLSPPTSRALSLLISSIKAGTAERVATSPPAAGSSPPASPSARSLPRRLREGSPPAASAHLSFLR